MLFSRYKNDPEILAMTNLIAAYQRNEILEFEKILKVSVCVYHDFVSWLVLYYSLLPPSLAFLTEVHFGKLVIPRVIEEQLWMISSSEITLRIC